MSKGTSINKLYDALACLQVVELLLKQEATHCRGEVPIINQGSGGAGGRRGEGRKGEGRQREGRWREGREGEETEGGGGQPRLTPSGKSLERST